MNFLAEWIIGLHAVLGPSLFLVASLLTALVLCFYITPVTTDLMVNHSAGLTGRFLGNKYRTYVINASTNNPEAANMLVSFALIKFGGWANPLGSLVANFYLIFLVAPAFAAMSLWISGKANRPKDLFALLFKERKLVLWHVSICLACAAIANLCLHLMRDKESVPEFFGVEATSNTLPNAGPIAWTVFGMLVGITFIVFMLTRFLQKGRPELFEEIDDSDHGESFVYFTFGTIGLVMASWLLNAMFISWERLYSETLTKFLGDAIFAILHFVVGALVTSLPEMLVAVKNYQRLKSADLNTALGSATYSNLVNLMLCLLGLAYFLFYASGGNIIPWD